MSKELTPLECVEYIRKQAYDDWLDDELDIIETALKDYERLKSRENNVLPNDEFIGDLGEHTRDEVVMRLKALEVIKEKKIDVYILSKTKSLDEYNKWYVGVQDDFIPLTQEEYDLLKEVLL